MKGKRREDKGRERKRQKGGREQIEYVLPRVSIS